MPLLSEVIAEYSRHRQSMDLARTTLRDTDSTMRRFLGAVGDVDISAVGVPHVDLFFEAGSETRQSQSQRNDYSRLAMFFDFCRASGYMPPASDPLHGRRRPRRVKRERNRLHVSKFPALLDAAEARDPRDRAAVAMLLYLLARDGEIGTVRLRDVDLELGRVRVEVHKTGQEDSMPICAELDRELRRWHSVYAATCGELQPHWYLLPARVTRPIREAGVIVGAETCGYVPSGRMGPLGKAARAALAGVDFPVNDGEREGAHTIRRSGARALYERLAGVGHDGAIRVVQSMLHHATMAQTEEYVGLTLERKTRDDLILGQELFGLDSVPTLTRTA